MKLHFKKLLCMLLAFALGLSAFGCGGNVRKYDSEWDPLSVAVLEMDGVFSPFFYTSGNDAEVIGMTQISMMGTTKNAELAYGTEEPVVALDYAEKFTPNSGEGETEYQIVIKKGIKFSDGTELTIKDVLFNMYVYLDPIYTGSSTLYSTDIIGLSEYRLQTTDQTDEDFEQTFVAKAEERVNIMIERNEELWIEATNNGLKDYDDSIFEVKEDDSDSMKQAKADIAVTKETFRAELDSDFKTAQDSYQDYNVQYPYQAFYILEGMIFPKTDAAGEKIKDSEGKYVYDLGKYDGVEISREQAIEAAYRKYIEDNNDLATVANYYVTASKIRAIFAAEEKSKWFENADTLTETVSGITVKDGADFIGTTKYPGYDVLSVKIKGQDPKAKWNLCFTVAPMHYYSDATGTEFENYIPKGEEEAVDVDYTSFNAPGVKGYDDKKPVSFGFKSHDYNYMTKVLQKVNGVPLGAGVYMGTDADNNSENLTKNRFFDGKNVYFERNPFFYTCLGDGTDTSKNAKIKYMRYKTIVANQMFDAVKTGEVHFAAPSATVETIKGIEKDKTLDKVLVDNLGYGYIGINAGEEELKNVHVRRALMYSMDTSLCLNYFSNGLAEVIHRPMSKVSWAYPEGATAAYPYDKTGEKTKQELKLAGYAEVGGKMLLAGKPLSLKFTVAGDTTDHPVFMTLKQSADILNSLGCDIVVETDSQALSKLASGALSVWAAAWSSTIDPDMFQVYHMDSKATSVLNWGYDDIKKNYSRDEDYKQSYDIITQLSKLIDLGRETLSDESRKPIYADALKLVMDLAVELPVYQRKELYVFNINVLDKNTMVTKDSEVSPYTSPLSRMWEVDFVH